jgi:hypothetical protein
MLHTSKRCNCDAARERYVIVFVTKSHHENTRNHEVSLVTLLTDFTFLSNRNFLFICYNIWAVFTSFLEKFRGPPTEFKGDSCDQPAAIMTCLIYCILLCLGTFVFLIICFLLICYKGFTNPDITKVHHIDYIIGMLSFLTLVSSVLSVWSLLTQVLILYTFWIHYSVPNDVNLVYCFCTKLMVLFTSVLIIT